MTTPLNDIVTSQKALKALRAEGWDTIEDLANTPNDVLERIKGVGMVTLEQLNSARAKIAGGETAVALEEPEWEESLNPIHLDSPFENLALRLTHAGEQRDGKRVRVINPLFLRFEGGRAQLRREQFLLAKFLGDKARAKASLLANEPWRLEAIEWLKNKPAYRQGDFVILTD